MAKDIFDQFMPQSTLNEEREKTLYSGKLVTRNSECYEKIVQKKNSPEGTSDEVIYLYGRFACGHLAKGKDSFGIEISDPPIVKNKELEDFYKAEGYLLVCGTCAKECTCGKQVSTITARKVDGVWLCRACYKKHKRKELWEKAKTLFKGAISE